MTNGKHEYVTSVGERKVLCRGLAASPGLAVGKVVIIPETVETVKISKGDILVTTMTSPDMISVLRKAGAVVTDEGGRTCHAAIFTRELGVPCIVGAGDATKKLEKGQSVIVDATRGVVFQEKSEDDSFPKTIDASSVSLPGGKSSPAEKDLTNFYVPSATATKIFLNLEGPASVDRCAPLPSDGVGLLRTEFIFMEDIGIHPLHLVRTKQTAFFVDKLAEGLALVAGGFAPRPVFMRFSDLRSSDLRKLRGGDIEPVEANPMIGWRGSSRYVSNDYEEEFRLECRAVKKVREYFGFDNLSVIIPFVRTLKEIEEVKKILTSEDLVSSPSFKIWIMVEVPSVVFQAEQFASLVDGLAIGSNDLTQLILGVDRDSAKLASMGYFDERHPAVLHAISMVVQAAANAGIQCSLCGEGPSVFPDFAEKLIRIGVDSISVNPDALAWTRRIVASSEQKLILDGLRKKARSHPD